MAHTIQMRQDTAANWTSTNPTLYSGEIGYETDTDKFKMGDGSTAWTSLTDYYEPGSSKTGRAATLVVAANNSTSLLKEQADYVCDGTNDQTEINAALTASKNVYLAEGDFSAYGIQVPDYTHLYGSGFGTKISLPSGATGNVITNSNHTAGNTGILINDLFVDGNDTNAVTYSRGIELYETAKSSILNCWTQNTKEGITHATRGIGIYISNGSTDVMIKNCFATDNGHEGIGIRELCERISVIGCVSWDNDFEGFQVAANSAAGAGACKDILLSGNMANGHASYGGITVHGEGIERVSILNNVVKGAGAGIYLLSDTTPYNQDCIVSNNIISDTKTHAAGIELLNVEHTMVTGNQILDGDDAGILISNSDYSIVNNNNIDNMVDYGIDVYSSDYCSFSGNTVISSAGGFYTNGNYGTFINNYIKSNEGHGVLISGTYHNILNNYVLDNNTDDDTTHYGINIANTYNTVLNNKIYLTVPTVGHQYGIHVSANNCIFKNNDIRQSGKSKNFDITGVTTIVQRNNDGYDTETSGTATLVNGNTTIAVTHGLDVTPAAGDIVVTPIEAWGSMAQFYIDTYTSTQFTIHADADPGQDVDFAWKAIIL